MNMRIAAASEMRRVFPEGTRIVLQHMGDNQWPVPSGTRGTVLQVNEAGILRVRWDSGICMNVIPGEDRFRALTAAEHNEPTEPSRAEINEMIRGTL